MKRFARLGWIAGLAMALSVSAAAKEEVVKMDASDGKSDGHWVMFLTKPMAPNAPMGTIVAAVGKGESYEGGFGMKIESARPQLGGVSADDAKAVRESDDDPPAKAIIVMATKEQYEGAKKAVEKYASKEEHIDRPPDVVVNFGQEVLDALGMKRPYRSGLGGLNAMQWYNDIELFNRKLKVDS